MVRQGSKPAGLHQRHEAVITSEMTSNLSFAYDRLQSGFSSLAPTSRLLAAPHVPHLAQLYHKQTTICSCNEPFQCFQSLSTRSFPPDATMAPSGLQSTANTSSAWPGKSSFSFRVRTSQTCTEDCSELSQKRSSAQQQMQGAR